MNTLEELPSLLLLPAPPAPPSIASLNAAYRPSLQAALTKTQDASRSVVLIVAVASPILTGSSPETQSLSWSRTQSLLAGLYSLVAAICAEHSIPSEMAGGPGSIDVRVVLVNHRDSEGDSSSAQDSEETLCQTNSAVIPGLGAFARAFRPWNKIFYPDGDPGFQLQACFLKHAGKYQTILQSQLVAVEGGVALSTQNERGDSKSQTAPGAQQTYDAVCIGGTFDYLHPGHKLLLAAGALLLQLPSTGSSESSRFIIGISGDELLKNKKFATYVQPWDARALGVVDFLSTLLELPENGREDSGVSRFITRQEPGLIDAEFRRGTIKLQCVVIQDAFGPTITDEHVKVLVVSGETRSGGQAVNDRRKGLGWKELEVYEVDVLDARVVQEGEAASRQDFSSKISSSAIRTRKATAAAAATAAQQT